MERRAVGNGRKLEFWFDASDQPVCGSKKRRAEARGLKPPHDRCTEIPMKGRNRCRKHGGESPRGELSPNFKHGIHVYYNDKPELLATFHRLLEDPDILNVTEEIALLRTHVAEVLGAEREELGVLWSEALGEARSLDVAIRNADGSGVILRMQNVLRILQHGSADAYRWREAMDSLETMRKLVTAETTRRIRMQEVVQAEDFMLFIMRLSAIVNSAKSVDDIKQGIHALTEEILGS